jgi:endonuclease/exonuclease/phosphatase family metal-dependent hydrolase
MLVRSWNLSHGNTSPPGRRRYLREMIELVTADRPGIVCLQEVPAWALDDVGRWAGMKSDSVRTRRPKLGFLPVPGFLGKWLTGGHSGLFRSALAGQGNVILVPKNAKIRERKRITLNTNVFCEAEAEKLGLDAKAARRWEKQRRVCHLVKIELANRRRLLVANLQTSAFSDVRLADAELRRAVHFVDRAAETEEIVLVAGDFGLTSEQSETLGELTTRDYDTYAGVGASPRSDHALVREARAADARVWGDEERTFDGNVLAAQPPLELQLLAKVAARPRPKPEFDYRPEAQLGRDPQPAPSTSGASERWETPDTGRFETEDSGWEESEKWDTDR